MAVGDDYRVEMEPRWVDVFRWETCRVDASQLDTGDELLDRIRQQLDGLADAADGRALAVRVEIEGASSVHSTVAAEPIRWKNEIRAAGQDVRAGSVWIEKVKLRTSPPRERDRARPAEGPIAELTGFVEEARSDPALLASLGEHLAPLRDKLPPKLREGSESMGLDKADNLRELLDHAEEMLIRRLLARETES